LKSERDLTVAEWYEVAAILKVLGADGQAAEAERRAAALLARQIPPEQPARSAVPQAVPFRQDTTMAERRRNNTLAYLVLVVGGIMAVSTWNAPTGETTSTSTSISKRTAIDEAAAGVTLDIKLKWAQIGWDLDARTLDDGHLHVMIVPPTLLEKIEAKEVALIVLNRYLEVAPKGTFIHVVVSSAAGQELARAADRKR